MPWANSLDRLPGGIGDDHHRDLVAAALNDPTHRLLESGVVLDDPGVVGDVAVTGDALVGGAGRVLPGCHGGREENGQDGGGDGAHPATVTRW